MKLVIFAVALVAVVLQLSLTRAVFVAAASALNSL